MYARLDPFYYMCELTLPSPYESETTLVISIRLTRLVLVTTGLFEFMRFASIIIFVSICLVVTMVTCLRKLIVQFRTLETAILQLYTQLRIVLKIGDFFLRNFILLSLLGSQIMLTAIWWISLKFWNILPFIITLLAWVTTINITVGLTIGLPHG